jgi:hypothetical protein
MPGWGKAFSLNLTGRQIKNGKSRMKTEESKTVFRPCSGVSNLQKEGG